MCNSQAQTQAQTQAQSHYYFNTFGHNVMAEHCHYRMAPTWIDTDNQVWAEPYHEYGS